MKLLLTSGGITNRTISNALFELVGKKPEEISLVFIPTASNLERGDKSWVIKDLVDLQNLHFRSMDIVDISAVDESVWRQRFEEADVLFFEGGNTYHLMRWMNKSGLAQSLPELLKNKVYVGVSAGSMVTNKSLVLKIFQIVYEEDLNETENMLGLNLVDFYFLPHLNSGYFPKLREPVIREAVSGMTEKIYALDDQSALVVIDGMTRVISEGEWFVVND